MQSYIEKALTITNAKPLSIKTKQHHVCFIVKNGHIIEYGYNKDKTHPGMLKIPGYKTFAQIHAEFDAITKFLAKYKDARKKATKCEIIVVRTRCSGDMANSKPCRGCYHLIEQMGFRAVWYSTEEGFKKLVIR